MRVDHLTGEVIPAVIAEAVDDVLATYVEMDRKVDAAEGEGIMARWEFGRALLVEREANGGKQLPHHRLKAICKATGKDRREIQYRLEFAEQYRTREEVRTAVHTFRSWTELRDSFASTGGAGMPKDSEDVLEWAAALDGLDDEDRLRALGIKSQPYDVWNFADCHDLMGDQHPGRIPGQLVCHVLYFFTQQGDLVIDPMAGSGTTLDACLLMGRRARGYDIDHRHDRDDIEPHDLDGGWPDTVEHASLVFWDPPYFDKMDHGYIDGSISRLDPDDYLAWFADRFAELHKQVKPGTRFAFLMSDWDPENAKRHGDHPGMFVWDYADRLRAAGWNMRRHIQAPLPTQQVQPYTVMAYRASRRLARLERYLLMAEA